jgi:WD40 repeat protein
VSRISFSPDGNELLIADQTCAITVWNPSVPEPSDDTTLSANSVNGQFKAAAFSPDGATIALGGDSGKIHLVDALTGQELLVLDGNDQPIRRLAFSPDGSSIAGCCGDGTVKIWYSGW